MNHRQRIKLHKATLFFAKFCIIFAVIVALFIPTPYKFWVGLGILLCAIASALIGIALNTQKPQTRFSNYQDHINRRRI